MRNRLMSVLMLAFLMVSLVTPLAHAQYYYGSADYEQWRRNHPVRAYFNRHPYQKTAAIGAGIGAAAGGILGAGEGGVGGGLVKGAVLGAGAGAGYEYLHRHVFNNW
jgi:hypothetical protein